MKRAIIIAAVIIIIVVIFGIFNIRKNINSINGENGNSYFVGTTRNGKEKKVNISEDMIKQKVKIATELIKSNYHTALTDIYEIKVIYNYKEKTIDNLYISVRFAQKLQVGYKQKSQATWVSLSKENVYNDKFITGIDANMFFTVENLNDNECLITEENNSSLTAIKEYMKENGEINYLRIYQK